MAAMEVAKFACRIIYFYAHKIPPNLVYFFLLFVKNIIVAAWAVFISIISFWIIIISIIKKKLCIFFYI